jgi:hypothetical protein
MGNMLMGYPAHSPVLIGPVQLLVDGSLGYSINQAIYLTDVPLNSTFGMEQQSPWPGTPPEEAGMPWARVGNTSETFTGWHGCTTCAVRTINGSKYVAWGSISLTVKMMLLEGVLNDLAPVRKAAD